MRVFADERKCENTISEEAGELELGARCPFCFISLVLLESETPFVGLGKLFIFTQDHAPLQENCFLTSRQGIHIHRIIVKATFLTH